MGSNDTHGATRRSFICMLWTCASITPPEISWECSVHPNYFLLQSRLLNSPLYIGSAPSLALKLLENMPWLFTKHFRMTDRFKAYKNGFQRGKKDNSLSFWNSKLLLVRLLEIRSWINGFPYSMIGYSGPKLRNSSATLKVVSNLLWMSWNCSKPCGNRKLKHPFYSNIKIIFTRSISIPMTPLGTFSGSIAISNLCVELVQDKTYPFSPNGTSFEDTYVYKNNYPLWVLGMQTTGANLVSDW